MSALAHLTIPTGHLQMVQRRDVSDEAVAAARAVIAEALTANAAELPGLPDHGLVVEPFGGAARFVVVAPPRDRPVPLVVFGVAPRAKTGRELWRALAAQSERTLPGSGRGGPPQSSPWCAAVPMPGLLTHPDAEHVAEEIGRIEAVFAWAWIERRDDQSAA